jgi:hypothetical protein
VHEPIVRPIHINNNQLEEDFQDIIDYGGVKDGLMNESEKKGL